MPTSALTEHCAPPDQEPTGDLADALEDYLPAVMRITGTPGVSVAIWHRGATICQRGWGFANLRRNVTMGAQTVSRAASISKLYTATAVLQLIERGVFDLYDPINAHLHSIRLANPRGEREITIYDLLTFRSGLGIDTVDVRLQNVPTLSQYLQTQLSQDIRREYNGRDLEDKVVPKWHAKVGEKYLYSNLSLVALGALVADSNPEQLGFADYVANRIFRPLNMPSSAFPDVTGRYPREVFRRLCTGYARFGSTYLPSPQFSSAGPPSTGLLTTAADHVRWLAAMLGGGSLDGGRALEPASVAALLTPQVRTTDLFPTGEWWNGLIVEMTGLGRSAEYFGEGGAYPWGWWSESRAYPNYGLALSVFTNRWDMPRWFNPPGEAAHGLVADFIARWFDGSPPRRSQEGSENSWAWKRSYVIGLLWVERTMGLLGVKDRLDECIVRMVQEEAHAASAKGGELEEWEPRGFRAGVSDMQEVAMTPSGIRTFLESPNSRVTIDELRLICLQFGRKGEIPMPMQFYAEAKNVGTRSRAQSLLA